MLSSHRLGEGESLYWIKHFSFRLAVVNVCPVLVLSDLLLSTHLPTSEGWTVDLTVGLWLVVPTTGFGPTQIDLNDLKDCTLTIRPHHHSVVTLTYPFLTSS